MGSVLDHSAALEGNKRLSETVIVDVEHVAQLDAGLRCRRTSKRLTDSLCEGRCGRLHVSFFDHLKVSLVGLMDERDIPFEVDATGELPVLSALACPFPELAKLDRSVCTLEKLMLSDILGEGVQLADCRLDGAPCCTFSPGDSPSDPLLAPSETT